MSYQCNSSLYWVKDIALLDYGNSFCGRSFVKSMLTLGAIQQAVFSPHPTLHKALPLVFMLLGPEVLMML